MKYRFDRNKVEEKIQKQIQDHVLKADDVKPGDMPQRIGIAATYSGNKLSTTLTADLADSDLDGVELKQAARLLAREYEMPLEQLARPLTSKKKKGPQLFEDPISGQPMTTKYAMNMLDKYETKFFTDTLRSYNKMAKSRGQKKILPGAAASAFDIIARNTSTDNLDFRKTLGASAAIAASFGKDKVKWANFNNSMSAIKQFASDLPDTDKIIMAQATALSGGVLKTGYDVATMRAMSMENLTENQRRSVLNKLQEAQAIVERKGSTATYANRFGPGIQAIVKPDGGLNWPAINALGEEERANVLFLLGRSQLEGTYDSNINAILEDAENDDDKFSTQMADHLTPSWLESGVGAGLKALDELTKAVNTAGELVRAGAAWARIDTIGGTGTAKASPEVIDAMVHEHLERAGEIWHGDYTLADSLQEDGVPPIAAMATETIFQMALDPTILAGQAVTATRAARSLEALRGAKGAESVVGAVDNLIYGSIKGTSASAYGRTVQGIAKGFQKATGRQGGLARFLVKAADDTGDDIEYYTRLANSFKKVGGGKGIHPKAATHIHDYVKAARVAKIPEDEIVTTVGDLLKGFMGQNLRGSKAEVLLNNIQDSKTTLGQQAERFGPDQPFYYGPHSDKVDEALTSAMRDMTGEATQGIFGVAPGTVRMTDIPFRPAIRARERINNVLGDSAIGKTWRSLGSHLPPTAATPEHDLDTFVHEMMARSGRYNRAEIAEKEAEALRIMRVGPGTGERETKFLKFMTDMQDDFILKESSRLGIRPEDADQLVSQARKKAIELHAAAYGIEPKELAEVLRKGTKAKVFRTPQFSTQLFNNFYAMDPKHIEDIFQQAIGYKQEAGQAFRRAFGKPMKEVALHENTFKAFNENWTKATLESINRAWKFSVVVSGRYVVRVVLMDEQLRYMNDLGVMSRAIGAGSRARKAEDLGLIAGNQVKRVFNPDEASWVTRAVSNAGFKDTDEVKSAITQFRETGVLSPQLEELTNDVPAARKVIDDVMGLPGKTITQPVKYPEGTLFHGTKADLQDISSADIIQYGDPAALAGPGLYLTDARPIAEGYARTRGKGPVGKVLGASVSKDVKFLEGDAPLPREVAQSIDDYIRDTGIDVVDPAFTAQGKSWMKVMQSLGDDFTGEISRGRAHEWFIDLQYKIEHSHGYNGVKYKGGVRTAAGREHGPHSVSVLWEPNPGDLQGRVSEVRPISQPDIEIPARSPAEPITIDEQIPIAGRIRDEEAVRPGSAADIFSSAEREEGVFRRFMKRKTKMGASPFDVVEPDNRGYMLSLEHVLKNQVAREPAGLIALRGIRDGKSPEQIRASLVKFFHTPEGKAVADRMGVPASGVNGRAEQIEYMVRGYIDADPQIANAVLEESQDLRRYLDRIPMANRQTVQGYAVSEVMGDETKGAAIMHTISRYMFENPTNALSRQPFFKQHYTNMRSFLYQNAADEGLEFTDDLKRSMDGAAKEFAINRTMDVMFDFRKQGRWSEMIRFVAPFAQPWAEAWTVWPRLMAKNPAFAARGVVLTKQFIDEGIIKKDKKTGEYVVPLTNHMMAAPILGMLFNGDGKNELPGWTLSAPLSSMNFMFSSMFKVPTGDLAGDMPISIPGLNPVANWALQRMANNTDIPMPDNLRVQLAATAFEYGSLQTGKEFVSGFLPGWVQAGAQKLGIFEDEAYLNKTATGLRRLYEARGLTPAVYAKANGVSLAEAETALQEKSLHQAKDLILTKSFFGTFFGFPTSPQIKMPTEELDIELREMREKYGLFEGNDRFNEKYGHKYFALTVGSTESDGYIPANDWVKELLITDPEAKEFAQRHPRFFMALVPSEHRDDPFSAQAYGRQFDMGLLSARDPEEFGQALDKGRGWAAFNELSAWKNRQLEQYKGLPDSSNPVEAINDAYTDRFNALQQEYPEWAKDYADQGPGDQFAIQEAQQVLKVPMFAKSDAGQGLKDYLLLRTRVRKQMAAHNLESLGTDTSADAGVDAMLENGVKAIIAQHPEYQIIHESLFSNDLEDANIQTEAAKIRAKQSPEEQRVQLQYETKLDQAQEKISRAFDMDDSKMIAKAYGERRQLYNQYYAKYGDTPENPVNVWWATRSEYTKKTTIENVATTPYIYLSQFDRRVILNEKTSDKAEKTWAKVLDAAGDWERQDRIAKAAAAHDPVFAEQLKHANDWGWAYKKMNDYTHENSNRGEAWSTFFDTLGKAQKEVEARNLHGINSYDPSEVAQYEQMRNHVETLVEHLGNHSEQFRTDWKRLPIEMFFPDNWYVLGRFD